MEKSRARTVFLPNNMSPGFSKSIFSNLSAFLRVSTLIPCGQGHRGATFPFFAEVAQKVARSLPRDLKNGPKINENRSAGGRGSVFLPIGKFALALEVLLGKLSVCLFV